MGLVRVERVLPNMARSLATGQSEKTVGYCGDSVP